MKTYIVCDILPNGDCNEYGIPIIAEKDADDARVMRLFGIQMGYAITEAEPGVYKNQYGMRYTVKRVET